MTRHTLRRRVDDLTRSSLVRRLANERQRRIAAEAKAAAAEDVVAAAKRRQAAEAAANLHEGRCPYCAGCGGRGCPWDGWAEVEAAEDALTAALAEDRRVTGR
jgi:hypothetical protein